jgi:hypothetical protein
LASGKACLVVSCALLVAAAGCGEGEGASEGATVTAYVDAPFCAGAQQELASRGGKAGDLHVRAVCLPSSSNGEKLNLAALGANARRATEDSTTVGYLEASDPKAARFTRPILESASIAWISQSSGKAAMTKLLQAIEDADTGSLRESVREALHET